MMIRYGYKTIDSVQTTTWSGCFSCTHHLHCRSFRQVRVSEPHQCCPCRHSVLSNILQIPLLCMSAVVMRGLIFVSCILFSVPAFLYTVTYQKVVLVPMQYARKDSFIRQLLKGHLHAYCIKAYIPSPFAYAQHINATARDMTMFPQHFCRIVHSIEIGNHAQRSRTANGGIMSPVMGENVYFSSSLLWIFIKLILYTYH